MLHNRPALPFEPSPFDRTLQVLLGVGLFTVIGIVASSWSRLPAEIPHHFNLAGEVDAWGGKWLVLIPPAFSLVLGLGAWWLARIPHRYNYPWPITEENAPRQYRMARRLMFGLGVCLTWMFATLALTLVSEALGRGFRPSLGVLLAVCLSPLALVVGYLIRASKAR